MEDAYTGLRWNLFPTIGANGPCQVHVNLGQSGFVFVEANVKKWGLAPSQGTLAPPPAYGIDSDTILLATAGGLLSSTSASSSRHQGDNYSLHSQSLRPSSTLITIDGNGDQEEEELMEDASIPEPPPYSSSNLLD